MLGFALLAPAALAGSSKIWVSSYGVQIDHAIGCETSFESENTFQPIGAPSWKSSATLSGAAFPCVSRLADVHGGVWGKGAGKASGGLNDVVLCPRCAVCCRLSDGSGIAARYRLRSCRWSLRCAAVVGSGVSGLDRGVWQEHYPRAGGWCAGVAVLGGLWAGSGRRLDGREERRWRHRCSPRVGTTAGTGRGTPAPNPNPGFRTAGH
jgi:hypothetical protein